MHPVETNYEVKTDCVKARWTSEELVLMAFRQAELLASGWSAEINSSLILPLPNRTRETIKGQRKSNKYRQLLEKYCENPTLFSGNLASTTSLDSRSAPSDSRPSYFAPSTISSVRRSTRNIKEV
ncbi:hypothetical protein AVEN_106362-1 [Araneus ventricosus]|uniref:Uncharacterized protein n=1 Tax=Araneus ventricosus TaxID=182803 RepID=A0A4Y2ATK2_ARAVE|nr:hypothetical protein AVEN_106362-1 [Araneus ventricosus]